MPIETEARFTVDDRVGFLALQDLSSLGAFSLRALETQEVKDVYMDTKGRRYLQAGYACRLREIDSELFLTIKSIESAEEDLHVRTEIEERMDDPARAARPELWPEGKARDLAQRISRGAILGTLCELRQLRWKREVRRKDGLLFELSIDEVHLPRVLYCVEIELREDGNAEQLMEFVKLLKKAVPLKADKASKLAHALEAAGIPFPRDFGRS
jgi:inorganic triphosphatase YgiF